MVNRLWNEIAPGFLHDPSNRYNWEQVTPGAWKFLPGVPMAGDALYMTGGTMNLVNNNLAGDTLTLSTLPLASLGIVNYIPNPPPPVHGSPVVNLTNSNVNLISAWNNDPAGTRIAFVNAYGSDTVNYVGTSAGSAISNGITSIGTQFNAVSTMPLRGTFVTGRSDFITVSGPGSFAPASFEVDDGGYATINPAVVGVGTFTTSGYHPPSLTFSGSVGSGQTINLTPGQLTINRPTEFHATVNASTYRDIISLTGLSGADGWSLHNDMLNVTSHGHSLNTLHLVAGSAAPTIGVYQTAVGVEIDFGITTTASAAGTALHHFA